MDVDADDATESASFAARGTLNEQTAQPEYPAEPYEEMSPYNWNPSEEEDLDVTPDGGMQFDLPDEEESLDD